jgi:hypothetical protein
VQYETRTVEDSKIDVGDSVVQACRNLRLRSSARPARLSQSAAILNMIAFVSFSNMASPRTRISSARMRQ